MSKSISLIDYGVIALFFLMMLGVGLYYSRRQGGVGNFFGSDKSVPWWLSGISFYMNSFSALAFVMYSELAYKFGWVPVTVSWLSVPAVLLGGRFLAVRWRRAANGSPIDFMAFRYTPKMCQTLAWLGLPMQLLDNAFKLLAIGTLVGIGMGFPLVPAIAISGAIIVIYTFLGGLKAALACDFIQFFVVLAVVLVLPFLCLDRLGEGAGILQGFRAFLDGVPPDFFSLTADKYDWTYMAVFFLCVGSTLSTNWSLVQRYYSTRSDRDARKMAHLVAFLLFLGPPVFFFPAMAARVFLPGLSGEEVQGVYALLCRDILPAGMIGMVIAAMFSATMSTLAGNFNAAASVLVNELYGRFAKRDTPARRMVAARIATLAVGGGVIALTFLMQYVKGADDLFNLTNKMFGLFLPPIAIPMLAGVCVEKVSKRSGTLALSAGILSGVLFFVAGAKYPFIREMVWMFPLTSLVTVATLWIASNLLPDSPNERAEIEVFHERIRDNETDYRR